MSVNTPEDNIAKQLTRWRTARDVVSGAYAIKARSTGQTYLPLAYRDQDTVAYEAYQKATPFYPAASRTLDGIVGLMMRKEPVLETDGLAKEIKGVITSNGDSVDELARIACREALTTNYCGLFTDYPEGEASSLGAMLDEGIRPFINFYPAESILECKPGVVRNQRVPVRVRLLDNENRVRILKLVDGYVVIEIYDAKGGAFPVEGQPTKRYEPKANGNRLTEIPFDLITTDNSFTPSGAQLDNVVTLNLDHYVTQGLLTRQIMYGISPMLFIAGVEQKEGETFEWIPGQVYTTDNADAKPYVINVPSDAAVPLEHQLEKLEDRMATVASRILARQKSVAEAAETEAVRQGAENSIVAMIANAVSARFERAIGRVNAFDGGTDSVRFQINTDYLPTNISPQEITALLGLREANEISAKSLFYRFRTAGLFNETLTFEEEQLRKAEIPATPAPKAAALTTTPREI
ncbi:DUF4055 domain-containing protein [Sphingomonas sp. M1A8_2b]